MGRCYLRWYPALLRRYPASPLSLRYPPSLVAVSCLALISAHPAWSCCGILLHCGGILPCPCRCGILLRCGGILPRPCRCGILPRLWRYPASPLSLHARRGLVAVSFFAAAVSCLALVTAVSFFAAAVSCLALVVCRFLQVFGRSTG